MTSYKAQLKVTTGAHKDTQVKRRMVGVTRVVVGAGNVRPGKRRDEETTAIISDNFSKNSSYS